MKKEKKDIDFSNFSLSDVIKRKIRRKVSFLSLEYSEQRRVLDFIKEHNLSIRVFGDKWYDILSKKFFVIEYKPSEKSLFAVDKIESSFDTFEDYYNHVQGDIYQNACYYGYCFSNDELSKFNIETGLLNFDSLINETIDLYTFESLNGIKKEENDLKQKIVKNIIEWFENYECPSSFEELETNYNQFKKSSVFMVPNLSFFLSYSGATKNLSKILPSNLLANMMSLMVFLLTKYFLLMV